MWRRVSLLAAEGVRFVTGGAVGRDGSGEKLRAEFDAVVLCGGATLARDLAVPGRDLAGIHLAMEFLHKNPSIALAVRVDADPRGNFGGRSR